MIRNFLSKQRSAQQDLDQRQAEPAKKRRTLLQRLENRILLNAVPDVSVDVADEALIGETVDFEITFDLDNNAAGPGFGPFIDIILPRNGADGDSGNDTPDGIGTEDPVSFDFFGTALTPVLDVTVDATGTVEHPLLRNPDGSPTVVTNLTPGDRFIVLQLPIGSYEPTRIPLTVTGTANISELADVGFDLPIQVRGGFRFGCDALDNPSVDDPNATVSSFESDSVSPEVVLVNKVVNADEQETATGRNFPKSYTIELNIADGQTVTNLDVTDPLSDRIVYLNNVTQGGSSPDAGTGTIAQPEPPIDDGPKPNSVLEVNYGQAEGTLGESDITVSFDFYVHENDADGNPIIDPMTGAPTMTQNLAQATYDWTPIDVRDTPVTDQVVVDPLDGADQKLTNKSIAVQKEVSVAIDNNPTVNGTAPGDVLEYRIEFQISDYFDFNNVVVSDLLSDGQSFDGTYVPQLELMGNNGNPVALSDFDAANYSSAVQGTAPYGTDIMFDVSGELGTRGLSTTVFGNDGLAPGTTGVIVYRAVVDSMFRDPALPPGDNSVVEGDSLNNSVEIQGTVLKPDGSEGGTPTDGSGTTVELNTGSVDKVVYAINGDTNTGSNLIGPGDSLTYRIQYDLPQTRFADLVLTDTLPLPILDASTITTGNFTSFLTGTNVPAVGEITYGPDSQEFFAEYFTQAGLTPTLIQGPGNSFSVDFGSFAAGTPMPSTIDLLFTVEFADLPFDDGLFLSNLIVSQHESTDGSISIDGDLAQIISSTPELNLNKGVVSTDTGQPPAEFDPNPVGPVTFTDPGQAVPAFSGTITSAGLAANPIDSNLSNVDAGDLVKFSIVVENTGNGEGFDLIIDDTLPSGFVIPTGGLGLNLQVTSGDGTQLDYTDADGNAITPGREGDFFFVGQSDGRGIRAVDPADLPGGNPDDGAIDGFSAGSASGSNVIVVTFDLEVSDTAEAGAQYTDIGTLTRFGAINNGTNWTIGVDGDFTDDAFVEIATSILDKDLITTEIISPDNAIDEAVIGELLTYDITVRVPEGITAQALLRDTFNRLGEVAFVELVSITADDALSTDLAGGFNGVTPVPGPGGTGVEFALGTITNTDRDNATDELITLRVTGVVLNDVANQAGTTVVNAVQLEFNGAGRQLATNFAVSEPATIIEPDLVVTKEATVNGAPAPPAIGDAGDPVTYTITIQHSGQSDTRAFDVSLFDDLPADFVNATITAVTDNAANPADQLDLNDFEISGGVLQFAIDGDPTPQTLDELVLGRVITVTVSGVFSDVIVPGQQLINEACVDWTSLPGDPGQRSTFNPNSVERTGADGEGGQLNDYQSCDVVVINTENTGLSKTVIATSEDHTGSVPGGIEQVAIGEIVRYRLVTTVPESTTIDVFIRDRLPNGLTYLNDGTTKVAFVGDDPDLFFSDAFDPTVFRNEVFVQSSDVTSVVPTHVLDGSLISSDPMDPNADDFTPGEDPYFSFGDVTNVENDFNEEFVILEFNALVNNVNSNQAGTVRSNQYSIVFDGQDPDGGPISNRARVQIVEPNLSIEKELLTTPNDAGDVVLYQITVTNASGPLSASAFDVNITDIVDPNLEVIDVTTFGFTPSSDLSSQNTIDIIIDEIPEGASGSIIVTARVIDTVASGLMINNTADVTYTSLPGEFGTSGNPTGSELPIAVLPNSQPGETNGERTGDGAPDPNALNNYFDSDSVKFTIDTPEVLKSVARTEYAIGEIVEYELLVTLSEGVTQDLIFQDQLPTGLQYVSYRVVTDAQDPNGTQLSEDFLGNLPTATDNNPTGDGEDLILTFGDTTTTPDQNINNNSFVVVVEARVLNTLGNQDNDTLTNVGAIEYLDPNNNTSIIVDTNSVDIDLIEPELNVDKQITSPAAGTLPDAGDTIEYTVVIDHDAVSSSDAFEVNFLDNAPLNTRITNVVSLTPSGFPTPPNLMAEVAPDGSSVVISDSVGSGEFDLPLGASVTIVYELEILDTITPGDMIQNEALIDWSSLDGNVNSGDEQGERDGSDRPDTAGLNNYFDDDSTKITTGVPWIDKVVVSSSVSETMGSDLAIGEEVTFRLTVTLPEETYPTLFTVTDDLPALPGPGVLQLVSAQFVAADSDQDITFSNLDVTPSSDQVVFKFDDLVNPSAVSSNDNLLVFDVVAVVVDDPANMNGDVLVNTGTVAYNNFSDSDDASVTIVEPVIEIDKSANTNTGSAGDIVTYTLVVTNDSADGATAPAYDLVITDELLNGAGLDDTLDLVAGSVTATSTGSGSLDIKEGNDPGDDEILVTATLLEVDETITIRFQAQLNANVDPAGDTVINTSDVKFDSLPGTGGRVGDDNDDHTITTPQESLGITKEVVATSEPVTGMGQFQPDVTDLAIGEVVIYAITIDLPVGLYSDPVIVSDQLPDFLALLDGVADVRVDSVGSAITLGSTDIQTDDLVGSDGYADQLTVTFNVDQVNLPAPGSMPADTQIVILVDAQVLNVIGNQATGTPLTNTAEVVFAQFTDSDSVDVELVEPELELEKAITSTIPPDLNAGDEITYKVTLNHTGNSTSDALNVQFIDTAPNDTLFTTVNLIDNGGVTGLTAEISNGGTQVRLSGAAPGEFDLALGETIELEYTIVLQDSVQLGQMLLNDAFVEWSSLSGDQDPGTETGERDGSDARDPNSLNNYFAFDQEKVTVGGFLDIDKSVVGPTEYAIGDTVVYELQVGLFEGNTPDVVIVDDIPDVMTVDENSVSVIAGSNITFNPTAPTIVFDGDTLTVDVGTVTNAGDNNPDNDFFTIRYEAVVKNDPGNANGQIKKNTAEVTSSNQLTDMDMEEITIVEPFLEIEKTISDDTPHLGDTVTYTFEISHTGQSTTDAYDLLIQDMLPPEVTVDTGTIQVNAPPGTIVTDNSSGNTIEIGLNELDLGETVTMTFDAEVTSDISEYGTMFTNTVELNWDSQPGTNPEERPDSTDDSAKATIEGPDLEIEKSSDATNLFPGDVFSYEIVVTNKVGPFSDVATGVTVVDVLPPGVTFVESKSQFFVSSDPTTGTVVWEIPTMDPGDTITLDLTVQLSDPAPPVEVLCNVVIVTHDDIDPTPQDNIDDEKTPIDESITPDLTITKDDGITQAFPGDVLTYEIIVTNVGPQDATGIEVVDLFPSDVLDFVSASNGGVFDPSTSLVTWNFPSIGGNGGQIILTLTGQVKTIVSDPTIMEFTNFVGVKDDGQLGPDPTPENNFDSDTDKVLFYGQDAFNDYLEKGRELPRYKQLEPLSDTVLSGTADPGTTLFLEIRDSSGASLGWRSVVADTAGNYIAVFQDVSMDDGPHRSSARQTFAAHNSSDSAGYNLRRYYEPATQAASYFSEDLTVPSAFRNLASNVLHSMQAADEQPLRLSDLDTLSPYQSLISSPLTGGR